MVLMDQNGTNFEVIVKDYMLDIQNVAYHETKNYIYWSSWSGNITRVKYPSVDNDTEVIFHQEAGHCVSGIAVDSTNDYLYWSNCSNLVRSNLAGSDITPILNFSSNGSIGTLEVDSEKGLIFFINNRDRSIVRCTVDGSDVRSIFSSESVQDFALDKKDERIYFTYNYRGLGSTTYYGNDLKMNSLYFLIWFDEVSIDLSDDNIFLADFVDMFQVTKHSDYSDPLTLLSPDYYMQDIKVYEPIGSRDCKTYSEIYAADKRSKDYLTDLASDQVISDEYLDAGWYRPFSANGDEMPTSPPGQMHCGTINPIWLNGTLPTYDDGNVSRAACVQTNNDMCEQSIDIEIRNCGGYFIYFLQKTPPNSSFCFGSGPVICPVGTSSETGFYPGCSSSYPTTRVSVAVQTELLEGSSLPIPGYDPTPSLLPVFRCKFDIEPNGTYIYDIYWYINEFKITSYTNIPMKDINITLLKHTDWIDSYKMNMEVQCAIRMRYLANSVPGPLQYSAKFMAGIFPEKYDYTVIEGDSITIAFKSTVPIGCIASHKNLMAHCDQSFYVFQPKKNPNAGSCSNNIAIKDIIFKAQFCGIKLRATDWQEEKKLEVYGFSDGLYNSGDRSTYIRLSTSAVSAFNEMWQNVQIPDIKVKVLDKDASMTSRLCQSVNDPHITTFDGKYYHFMDIGEFVMYRNDKGPYWVHALLTNCGFGWQGSACHCAIAIRSRSSLFVIRTCKSISRTKKELLTTPVTKLISCDDNDLLIDFNQGRNEYKVTLPIGTEIKISVSRGMGFISTITVKPSIYDINEAKGLCGVPSVTKDPSDDYTHRDNGPVNSDQEFAKSWRITSAMTNEQLFVDEPDFITNDLILNLPNNPTIINNSTTFCTCEDQAGSTDSLDDFNIIQCNLTESTEFCSSSQQSGNQINSYSTTCTISKRKRRSLDHSSVVRRSTADTDDSDDVTESQPLVFDEDINSTDVISQTFRNGWTAEKAYQTCQEALTTAIPSDVYSDVVEVDVENFIQSCVSDIEVTGDKSFLTDTINAMATNIMTEISRNESLFIVNTTDGSQTILEQITSKLCINNCSNNGICVSGQCECSNEYIGDDCSKYISTPPVNISLPAKGLCTTTTRSCKKTNIYGDFLSMEVWYKIRYFKVVENSKLYSSNWEIYKAQYRNMFMVTVDLDVSRKTRSVAGPEMAEGYEITLSNDGNNFGEEVSILIYDERCVSCNSSMICVSLEVCESSKGTAENDEDSTTTIIAVASSCGVICVIVFVLAFLFYLKHKHTGEKSKVGVYFGCQHENGKNMDNGKLSNRTEQFRENTISDLDVHFEEGKEASMSNFENQLPPQNHFYNN
ncbi:Hypothetical predicted protein [Mytilus galloprovincialis]|uniref:VWFD domain-containing protein n=1 Tax=Mytilus galloprovincialis TaxID=29158 RepID=A0A8B6HHJ9_MYTGA|nr:Hypothetical predicted protein [Mytilus galloprovincialis]